MTETNHPSMPGSAQSANTFAWFRDILTVTGLVDGMYSLVPTVSVTGTGSWDNVPFQATVTFGIVEWGADGSTIVFSDNWDATVASYSESFTLTGIAFEAGVPFNFMLGFGEAARIWNLPGSENSIVTATERGVSSERRGGIRRVGLGA